MREKVRVWLFILILTGLGGYMIIQPQLLDEAEVSHSIFLLKIVLQYIWGTWCGIFFMLLGALLAWGAQREYPNSNAE